MILQFSHLIQNIPESRDVVVSFGEEESALGGYF